MKRLNPHSKGFTLLEVMVAMSILALTLTVIAGVNANNFESSNYANHLTVATLLARSKMIDVENELQKDGFGSGDREWSGDFSDEGYSEMRWAAVAREVDLDVGQLFGSLLGEGASADSLPSQLAPFAGLIGGGDGAASAPPDGAEGGGLASLLGEGGGGNILETILKQVSETLSKSIREVSLEIFWGNKDFGSEESVKFVQYLTTEGRLSLAKVPATPVGLPGATNPGANTPANGAATPGAQTP